MKKVYSAISVLAAAACLTGCVSDGLSMQENPDDYGLAVNALSRAASAPSRIKALRGPIRLAVAQIGENAPPEAFTDALGHNPLIQQTIPIPMPAPHATCLSKGQNSQSIPKDRIESAEALSREVGANYLLMVGGTVQTRSSHTALSVMDLTIVGGMLAPGTTVHAEGKAAGAFVDLSDDQIVFLTNVETNQAGHCPSFYTSEKRDQLDVKMRHALLQQLAADFLARLHQHEAQAN